MKKFSFDKVCTNLFYILLLVTAIWDGLARGGIKIPRIGLILITVILLRILFTKTFLKRSKVMYVAILFFIFLSMYLANVMNFYNIAYYDKILHFVSGFLVSIFGFIVFLHLFGDLKKNNIKPIAVFTFMVIFSIASAGAWEIWEFTTDSLFNLQAQDGLKDTMWDIILGSLSGIIMSIQIYLYSKGKHIKFIDMIVKEVIT